MSLSMRPAGLSVGACVGVGIEGDVACLDVLRDIDGAIDLHRAAAAAGCVVGCDGAIEFNCGGCQFDFDACLNFDILVSFDFNA